jgi:hypothetical protein
MLCYCYQSYQWVDQVLHICGGLQRTVCSSVNGARMAEQRKVSDHKMNQPDLGANHFTFTGESTQIDYQTQAPGSLPPGTNGGQLDYKGPEGDLTFRGSEINILESELETLVSVPLKRISDAGSLHLTILIPRITVRGRDTVSFATLGIKTAKRGFIESEGPDATYAVFPFLGKAQNSIEPSKG